VHVLVEVHGDVYSSLYSCDSIEVLAAEEQEAASELLRIPLVIPFLRDLFMNSVTAISQRLNSYQKAIRAGVTWHLYRHFQIF
jgi:hypothetical protein